MAADDPLEMVRGKYHPPFKSIACCQGVAFGRDGSPYGVDMILAVDESGHAWMFKTSLAKWVPFPRECAESPEASRLA